MYNFVCLLLLFFFLLFLFFWYFFFFLDGLHVKIDSAIKVYELRSKDFARDSSPMVCIYRFS